MSATTSEETKISLKILVDKDKNRVVFTEAGSDFIDILFSFMTLPMGTIVRLLKKCSDETPSALGCLNNLNQGLVDLPEEYFGTEECKLMLLNPRNAAAEHCRKLKLNIDDSKPIKYFICQNRNCTSTGSYELTTYNIAKCIKCGKLMDLQISQMWEVFGLKCTSDNDGAFVYGKTTFIVTDDLRVMPNTPGHSIPFLRDLGITCISHLVEKTVDIGLNEILDLLKWGMLFKSPLSCLLLPKSDLIQNLVCSEKDKSDQKSFKNLEKATNSEIMTLEVSIQRSTSKILFAAAKEDFVDFVLGFLTLPLGTVIGKLNSTSSLGCMDNLRTSILNMSVQRFFKSQYHKDILLWPPLAPHHLSKNQIFSLKEESFVQLYRDRFCPPSRFPDSWNTRTDALRLKDPRVNSGFLKGPTLFMVTDDLVITPFSSISSLNLLNKLEVSLNDVEEHVVTIGMEEALRILKASLTSSAALTNGIMLQLKKLNQINC